MTAPEAAVVRHATPRDVDALVGISARAWERAYRGVIPDGVLEEWIASVGSNWGAAFENRAPDNPWRAWLAERGGTVLGFAVTTRARDMWLPPPDGAGELTSLYLDPDAIGTGLGRQLFEHAVADLRVRGFNPLVVWAFRDNPLARRFYEKVGLTIDVPDHDWVLGDVPCPIVRFRRDWPADGPA
jgi:GNAT superfamily N-acetyltransferase